MEEIAQWLEEHKLNFCHVFTVDDLHHLYRGGRVSRATAVLGSMINIKPLLHVDDEGHLVAMEKVRGRRASLDALVKHFQATAKDPAGGTVFISHGDCQEDAEYVAALVKERYGIEKVLINTIGATIGAHAGPGTVALFFLGDKR